MTDGALTPNQGVRTAPKMRDSNLELYRLIVMFLIVIHHYVVNSGLASEGGPIYANPMSWRSIFLLLAGAWGKTGINCFVLITGYFMCKSNITLKKFVRLVAQVLFYRVIIYAIFVATGYEQFSIVAFVKLIIPIRTIELGFTPAFLLFFLCVPFLNILVKSMTRKQHALLLVLCGFAYVFLGTVPGFSIRMNYTSWFCVLFLIASFIRLYPIKLYSNNTFWGIATLAAVAVSAMSVVCCVWLGEKIGRTGLAYLFVQDSNTLLAVLTGICSFMFFKNLKIPQNKVINTMAASTFGVFCIHANSDTMRNWLWKDTVRPVEAYGSLWMPLHAVGCSLAIFMVCIGIDILRIQLIEKYGMKLWDILEKKWNKNKMLGKDK